MLHEIKCLKILNELGAPLYAYNSIMKWAHEANADDFNLNTKAKTCHQVVHNIERILNLQAF